MGRANACTRVIPFDVFVSNPYYSTGLLYYTQVRDIGGDDLQKEGQNHGSKQHLL